MGPLLCFLAIFPIFPFFPFPFKYQSPSFFIKKIRYGFRLFLSHSLISISFFLLFLSTFYDGEKNGGTVNRTSQVGDAAALV